MKSVRTTPGAARFDHPPPRRVGLVVAIAFAALTAAAATPAATAQDGVGACVENLTLNVNQDARRVVLSWDAVDGAGVYHVTRSLNGAPEELLALVPAGTTTYADENVPEGVVEYRVAADGAPGSDCPFQGAHIHGPETPPSEVVCVPNLTAEARPDGTVRLSWDAVDGAESIDVVRAVGDGPFRPLVLLAADATGFVDSDVEVGVTYRYAAAANGLPPEEDGCAVVEATAIPFFPAAWTAALAALGAVGAVLVLRRR